MRKTENAIQINEQDNVVVAIQDINESDVVFGVTVRETIAKGHKIAIQEIKENETIVKYGYPIGHATQKIEAGCLVHTNNLRTNLNGIVDYQYEPTVRTITEKREGTFKGYKRETGKIGIRNEIWIINTVGCVNQVAEKVASIANEQFKGKTDGIFTFAHPFGCSQLGEDFLHTQHILANMVNHPNAAGVLVLGLGCENNHIHAFQDILGTWEDNRVKFLVAQESQDEIADALQKISELVTYASSFEREDVSLSHLVIGLKCGGSDGLSGITANPLVGKISDRLVSYGGTTVLSEVPEMFGAETILMNRCETKELFDQTVALINDFKHYFIRYNQEIYENPSPGNKNGGISTLEDKSLGCTQKGGTSAVTDVLDYGDTAEKSGLNLLKGPGNDMVAITGLMAAGCHLILFTTGRGTPVGTAVPTVKIASNSELAKNKRNWIDFDAGVLLGNIPIDTLANQFFDYLLALANGDVQTKNEFNGYREISIFKDGVTL